MHSFTRMTPLGADKPRRDSYKSIQIEEVTDFSLASLTARKHGLQACEEVIKKLTGNNAPQAGFIAGSKISAFWVAQGQWMIEAPFKHYDTLTPMLEKKLNGIASVTKQSDGWVRFDLIDLKTKNLPKVFALLCPLDTERFKGGEALSTPIHHMSCFVICRNKQHYSILGLRSQAGSLHHALLTAIRSAV